MPPTPPSHSREGPTSFTMALGADFEFPKLFDDDVDVANIPFVVDDAALVGPPAADGEDPLSWLLNDWVADSKQEAAKHAQTQNPAVVKAEAPIMAAAPSSDDSALTQKTAKSRKRARSDNSDGENSSAAVATAAAKRTSASDLDRKEKNRRSAAQSRERKKAAMDSMLLRCKALESTNATLTYLLSMANTEIHTLKKELASQNTGASGALAASPAEHDFLPMKSTPKSSLPRGPVDLQRLQCLVLSLCLACVGVQHPGLLQSRDAAKQFQDELRGALAGQDAATPPSLYELQARLRRWYAGRKRRRRAHDDALAKMATHDAVRIPVACVS